MFVEGGGEWGRLCHGTLASGHSNSADLTKLIGACSQLSSNNSENFAISDFNTNFNLQCDILLLVLLPGPSVGASNLRDLQT